MGGPGCLNTFTGESPYVNELRSINLIDHHILGDAEISLVKLLQGEINYPGIDDVVWTQLTSDQLSAMQMPNYDDYNFDLYSTKELGIVGSRGCVRQCTFCDFIANWTKFQWRTADSIFNEMKTQSTRYKINNFRFQDALVNGNVKEFNKLMQLLADYNEQNPENKLEWNGYYIFREPTASSDRDWELIKKSGATALIVGI